MFLRFTCDSFETDALKNKVRVEAFGVDIDVDDLKQKDIEEFISEIGESKILDLIDTDVLFEYVEDLKGK